MEYRHIRAEDDQRGGLTLCFDVKGETAVVGYSECSRKDMFCKRTGRTIAEKRMVDSPIKFSLDVIKEYLKENMHYYFKGLNSKQAFVLVQNIKINEVSAEVVFDLFMDILFSQVRQ